MATSTITLAGNPVTLVAMPTRPGWQSVEFSFADAVAAVTSPFTGQVQTQTWPGAETLTGTLTLPKMVQHDADAWISFLMELRGMKNGFLLGDPTKTMPAGSVSGTSTPVAQGTANVAGVTLLQTGGWAANLYRLLLPGDYVQVGYRLLRNLEVVNSSSGGAATLTVWPALRETVPDGTPLVLRNPQGVFRLKTNTRTWSADMCKHTALSFGVMEYR